MSEKILFIIVFIFFIIVGALSAFYTRYKIKKENRPTLVGGKLHNGENPVADSAKYLKLVNY